MSRNRNESRGQRNAHTQTHTYTQARQGDALTFILKHQLPDAFVLIIVPDHDFVGGVPGVPPTPHNCYQVASKEHFHYPDSYKTIKVEDEQAEKQAL